MSLVKIPIDYEGTFPDDFDMWEDIKDSDDEYYYVDSSKYPDNWPEGGNGIADFVDAYYGADITMKPSQAGAGG